MDLLHEGNRLSFLKQRDGEEAAIDFAKRTIKVYRTAVLRNSKRTKNPHHASIREFKRGFILSYLDFRKYLQLHQQYGK